MPQSKKRKAHTHPHIDYIPHKPKKKSTVTVAIIVCTVLSIGIAWFASGGSIPALIAGVLAGVVIGYFAGKQMDKAFDK